VDSKWPGFRAAFHAFDVTQVAAMSTGDVERLAADDRVIKYPAKLKAVVDNAQHMTSLAHDHGAFATYVDGLVAGDGIDGAAKVLAKQFAYISEDGARNWLYSTGYDIGPVSDKVREKYAPFD
jgi:3-methyladenine DNA glycosylase Tag